jgi:hypothetical protein
VNSLSVKHSVHQKVEEEYADLIGTLRRRGVSFWDEDWDVISRLP